MEPWLLAILLRPIFALAFSCLIGLPVRLAIAKWMKDGKVKRALLMRIGED